MAAFLWKPLSLGSSALNYSVALSIAGIEKLELRKRNNEWLRASAAFAAHIWMVAETADATAVALTKHSLYTHMVAQGGVPNSIAADALRPCRGPFAAHDAVVKGICMARGGGLPSELLQQHAGLLPSLRGTVIGHAARFAVGATCIELLVVRPLLARYWPRAL
jgi:hypothetical protein